jgi:pyruvate dehydrogenase E2 component (dihydrolipoamide acetyltransferase)
MTETAHLVDVAMPRLSDSMEEATILEWLKRPGDEVRKGEPLVEVETDKATVVYEAERAGVLEEIVVDDGGTAALGEVIARLRTEGGAPVAAESPVVVAAPVAAAPAETAPADRERESGTRHRATPVARRLAGELGVSLGAVAGTGPGGRIVGADVRAAAGNGSATAVAGGPGGRGEVRVLELTATQRTIAQRMSESRREIPEFTLESEIDIETVARMRDELRTTGREPLPSFNDFVVRAVALALAEFPRLNASYEGATVQTYSRINVGIAVATDDALLVPTIHDANAKSVFEIAAESRRLAEKVRDRSIGHDDLADGTFTVSNLGMFGVRRFTAVINHPQAAILAVGEVTARPTVVAEGALVARRLMDISLSCDHRIVYGAEAARFLQRVRTLLEEPEQLLGDRKG